MLSQINMVGVIGPAFDQINAALVMLPFEMSWNDTAKDIATA